MDAWPWLNSTIGASYTTKQRVVLTPDQMGLAINSVAGRGLNQLHIHMACFDANVQAALAAAAAKTPITTTWSAPIVLKNGHGYRAILLTNLASSNPFLVMQSVKGYNPKDPGKETLVLTGKPKGQTNGICWRIIPTTRIKVMERNCSTRTATVK